MKYFLENQIFLFFFLFFYIVAYAMLLFFFLGGRKLLQASELEQQGNDSYNCTSPAIKEFPSDGFTRQQRQAGFVIIHFVIAIYLFLLLAIVCDDYFVPSIKKICESEYITEGLLCSDFTVFSRIMHISRYILLH